MATKKGVSASPRRSPEEVRWRAQDDIRTLRQAQEIQSSSSRMKAAVHEARTEMNSLAKVASKTIK